ncbi:MULTISPECIES: efflux RND transporter periplasmic adaptor subunit [unclassified Tenacibaculum]|uniref:efflux RND transporter periplasmic adaptor subunit n=1 Tax=unclassified Tenacibaculum TaxID=2635139 RepID=UPI001F356284|nr:MULTISPECIES: efflux RND transporter periplasmic adaptor subunit [unclassified Tenacibaculum]MCF2876540.1 efflux RND transporter periplasmic adaptor subunit [Tenacibaculum sp. Cn5-1]MCF2936553.1 efflux RND transporter periplasmic adaptor subunit [Tenacibaculum sp. Cn5-34]MCG7511854.1 efflux RND transporter periplasmic adaptor subunit [Tenacibaculum sp. Cn5-46]
MQRYIYITLVTAFLISCGGEKKSNHNTQNLAQLQKSKAELSKQKSEIIKQLKLIESQINKLDTSRKIDLVSVKKITPENFNHYLEIQGNIETKKNVLIYPEVAGLLEHVYVKKGQHVKNGQLLASINDGGFSQQISQFEVQRDLAKTTFERQTNLWKKKIGSEIQYLQAKTNYESKEKALQQLKERYSKTQIKAPFSGIIDDIIKEQGTIVSPGASSEVFRIVNLQNMYIEADIPESYIQKITIGKPVEINIPTLGKTITSKIRQVSNYIHPESRTFSIEVPIANKKGLIKPNLTAQLKINDYNNSSALLIPKNIISEDRNNIPNVFIVKNKAGKEFVEKRQIVTGNSKENLIEVIEGLENNDQVVLDGARKLKAGQEVKILKN